MQRSAEFAEVRRLGRRVVRGCLVANWLVLPPGAHPKLGVITSRQVGPAVARSRARRLLREAYRLHQHEFQSPVALVLVARRSIVGKTRQAVEHDLLAVVRTSRLTSA
jgi:ribonuclease P protein component